MLYGRRFDCRSSFSTSPCPSPRPLSAQYCSTLVGTRLSIFFSVVLSPFPFCIRSQNIPQYVFFSFLLITWPQKFNDLSVICLEACVTLPVPRMCSFLILYLPVTPHIHRGILISFTSIRFSCITPKTWSSVRRTSNGRSNVLGLT